MLDLALKNLSGHKTRTILTALGIVIAITAIVSLGSISAGMNDIVENTLKKMGSDTIFVMKRVDIAYNQPVYRTIDESIAGEIEGMDGVKKAIPIIRTNYLGMLPVVGINRDDADMFNLESIEFKDGGWYEDDDFACIIGKNIAEERNLGVGDEIEINNKRVEIVGVFEAGEIRGMNYMVVMPYKAAQDVFDMDGKATVIIVKPTSIELVETVKNQINDEYDELEALGTEDMLKRARNITSTVSVVTLGIGFVASIVAAIGVIITMLNSVHERKRQIGIMKAIGASRLTIITEVLQESFILSVLSGIAGIVIGAMLVSAINKYLLSGFSIAMVTPELAAGALAYGILLAIIFSLYPAWRAASINAIDAIRD